MTLEYVHHLRCGTVPLSLGVVGIFVPPRLLGRRLQEAPVSWFDFCRKCCHFFGVVHTDFCVAFLCPFSVVELCIDRIQATLDKFLMSIVLPPGSTCQTN